jgi:hypothetical protein
MVSSAAERQLVLTSSGTAARRAELAGTAGRLAERVDWRRLEQTLRLRKLLPTLGPRILELSGEAPSGDFAAAVESALVQGRRQGAFLQLVSLRIASLLADAGIRSAALKGPLLGEAIYGDPGRRLSSDIDLLVPAGQLHEAVEVVRELGYVPSSDHPHDTALPLLHFVLVHEQHKLPPLELHWRVHWYEESFAEERLLPPGIEKDGRWRPPPAAELAALLLFYARDGFIDLRLATDLSAWWDACGESLRPGALDELLTSHPALARVLAAALEAAGRTVGLPADRVLCERRRLGRRERLAARLANPNPHASASQLYADMGLIDGLLAPPGGFRAFVRRQVLPSAAVLEQQARHGSRRRARSQLGRGAGVLARYVLSLTRLLRARDTPSARLAR